MRSRQVMPALCLLLAVPFISFACRSATGKASAGSRAYSWPQWRGPFATGVAPHAKPPSEWSETKNVRWKVELPGEGHGTPIVWGERIYLTAAVATAAEEPPPPEIDKDRPRLFPRRPKPAVPYRFVVMALDLTTGQTLWQRTARELRPHEGSHITGSLASASPITDGERLYAYFGSRGLYCYTATGKLLWSKDLGNMTTRNGFGEGSSPALYGDSIVINWDHEGDSFIVALDKKTGKKRWRRSRDEPTSWSTPLIVEVDGRALVIVAATGSTRAYDLATGEVIWHLAGMTRNTIPTPVTDGSTLYLMSGFQGKALQAIRLAGAQGDLAGTSAVVWSHNRDTPYVASPLLQNGRLCFLKSIKNLFSCYEAETGRKLFGTRRLEGIHRVFASPVAAAGHIYITGREGTTVVVKSGPTFEVLATNQLDDTFDASPAVVGDTLLLRGHRYLYAIAETPTNSPAVAAGSH